MRITKSNRNKTKINKLNKNDKTILHILFLLLFSFSILGEMWKYFMRFHCWITMIMQKCVNVKKKWRNIIRYFDFREKYGLDMFSHNLPELVIWLHYILLNDRRFNLIFATICCIDYISPALLEGLKNSNMNLLKYSLTHLDHSRTTQLCYRGISVSQFSGNTAL